MICAKIVYSAFSKIIARCSALSVVGGVLGMHTTAPNFYGGWGGEGEGSNSACLEHQIVQFVRSFLIVSHIVT